MPCRALLFLLMFLVLTALYLPFALCCAPCVVCGAAGARRPDQSWRHVALRVVVFICLPFPVLAVLLGCLRDTALDDVLDMPRPPQLLGLPVGAGAGAGDSAYQEDQSHDRPHQRVEPAPPGPGAFAVAAERVQPLGWDEEKGEATESWAASPMAAQRSTTPHAGSDQAGAVARERDDRGHAAALAPAAALPQAADPREASDGTPEEAGEEVASVGGVVATAFLDSSDAREATAVLA